MYEGRRAQGIDGWTVQDEQAAPQFTGEKEQTTQNYTHELVEHIFKQGPGIYLPAFNYLSHEQQMNQTEFHVHSSTVMDQQEQPS